MRTFKIEQSKTEILTPHGGLALVGHCLNQQTTLHKTSRSIVKRHGIANIDLIRTYLGLICLGKSDFEAVEQTRHDPFFRAAMGIKQPISSARLRQRFDEDAPALIPLLDAASVEFMKNSQVPISALSTGHVPLDMDVFPMDNSNTKKEGVSYTYKGHDGYAPIAGYLGREGWCVACELRPGSQHSNNEFLHVLERVLPRVRTLTDKPVLVRLDSAHDALENRKHLSQEQVDYLIKWNPRKQEPFQWYEKADAAATWHHPRQGKMEAIFSEVLDEEAYTRRVVKVTVRMSNRHGQLFLEPQIELEGWMTSLPPKVADDKTIIKLYRDHATSEQFHSEFKTDLDLERLPSGKFDTNDLVMAFAVMAYNILRWMGLRGLMGDDAPVRHKAKRRRLKTVMQELMYMACRMISSGRQLTLRFGKHCPGFSAFSSVYGTT
tara:strand:+ start:156 stop:1460 length:1305 start_codon:yes stop_codon:yes gene_type:complete